MSLAYSEMLLTNEYIFNPNNWVELENEYSSVD